MLHLHFPVLVENKSAMTCNLLHCSVKMCQLGIFSGYQYHTTQCAPCLLFRILSSLLLSVAALSCSYCSVQFCTFFWDFFPPPRISMWYACIHVLVQVGEILDRGEDEIAVLSLLSSLNMQAKSQGDAVFQVWPLLPILLNTLRLCWYLFWYGTLFFLVAVVVFKVKKSEFLLY